MPDVFGEGSVVVDQVGGHVMPPWVKSQVMRLPKANGVHIPAGVRIAWFRSECPDMGMETEIVAGADGGDFACVRAIIRSADGRVLSTATKTETKVDFPGAWLEKAETGAMARAVAALGFGPQYSVGMSASDDNGKGIAAATSDSDDGRVWPGPGQCPGCHAPGGKAHANNCRQSGVAVSPDHVSAPRQTAAQPAAEPQTAQTSTARAETATAGGNGAGGGTQQVSPQQRAALFATLGGAKLDSNDRDGRARLAQHVLGPKAPGSWSALTSEQAGALIDWLTDTPREQVLQVWGGFGATSTAQPAAQQGSKFDPAFIQNRKAIGIAVKAAGADPTDKNVQANVAAYFLRPGAKWEELTSADMETICERVSAVPAEELKSACSLTQGARTAQQALALPDPFGEE